ncbi:MAG: redoxin family protein, partial [Pirellulales bacterium]
MHRCWLHVALTLCTAALLAGPAGPVWGDTNRPSGALEIGQAVPALQFKDIRYLWRTLEEFGEPKAYVLAFTTTACPVAQRYLPVLKRLEETYRARGVQFVAVNVGADDSIKDMAYQAIEHDVPFPFVKDATGEAARVLGVGRTPEVVVLDSERRLRYRGRIDRRYRVSGVSPQAGRADLQEAIEDVLAGRDVRLAETPVDGCLITLPDQREPDDVPTFAQDIAPLVQEHCQECHRPGREAPFSLITYDDVRAMGDMIAEVVAERRMPPWYASDKHGEFINRRALSRQERQTIADWVLGGMPAGDMEKMPEPPRYSDQRWLIGEPDLVVTMAETVTLPAEGYIPYKYFVLPYVFPHDTWVERI